LPPLVFAQRGDVFGMMGGHRFPAKAVCVAGKWRKGQWVNGASRGELERKFGVWVDNLSLCVDCSSGEDGAGSAGGAGGDGANVAVEEILVQHSWYQNRFIFATRRWSTSPPRSAGEWSPGERHSSTPADAEREQVLAQWANARKEEKRKRRLARKIAGEARWSVRVTIDLLGPAQIQLRCTVL